MQLVTLYDDSGKYIASDIDKAITHHSILRAEVNNTISAENFVQFKDAPFDAFLLAIETNSTLERILLAIRKANIDKLIFIVRLSTLQNRLPIMEKERFLKNRVEQLNPAPKRGGGQALLSAY